MALNCGIQLVFSPPPPMSFLYYKEVQSGSMQLNHPEFVYISDCDIPIIIFLSLRGRSCYIITTTDGHIFQRSLCTSLGHRLHTGHTDKGTRAHNFTLISNGLKHVPHISIKWPETAMCTYFPCFLSYVASYVV